MNEPMRINRHGDSQSMPTSTTASENVTPPLCLDIISYAKASTILTEMAEEIAEDIKARTELGIQRYGTPLKTWNGRNATLDAYEECADMTQYLKQRIMENPNNGHYKVAYWNAIAILFTLKEDLAGG